MLDQAAVIQRLLESEARDWLVCFLYVLKGMVQAFYNILLASHSFKGIGLSVQSEWLRLETPKRKRDLLEILTFCIKTFEVLFLLAISTVLPTTYSPQYPGKEECTKLVTNILFNSFQMTASASFENDNLLSPEIDNRRMSIKANCMLPCTRSPHLPFLSHALSCSSRKDYIFQKEASGSKRN